MCRPAVSPDRIDVSHGLAQAVRRAETDCVNRKDRTGLPGSVAIGWCSWRRNLSGFRSVFVTVGDTFCLQSVKLTR